MAFPGLCRLSVCHLSVHLYGQSDNSLEKQLCHSDYFSHKLSGLAFLLGVMLTYFIIGSHNRYLEVLHFLRSDFVILR